jgi:lipopolysaccharide biosynthesis glycosyltransferase
MNIVCTIDEAYAQHCGVMLCSLFVNNPDVSCRVFVVTNGLSAEAREKLSRIADASRHRLEFRLVDQGALRLARVFGHVSIATYFRVLIPRILPCEIDRVLFLDSDLIVRGRLQEFYEQPLDGWTHAAVENPCCTERVQTLGMPTGSRYFNGGVLLLNLRAWREEKVCQRLLDYIEGNAEKLLWWDQDALNATLHGRWKRCRATWNAQEAFFVGSTALDLEVTEDEFDEARSRPRIVHFSGSAKPWTYYTRHPYKGEYYTYLARTPWKGFRPHDRPSTAQRARLIASRVLPGSVKRAVHRLAASFASSPQQVS